VFILFCVVVLAALGGLLLGADRSQKALSENDVVKRGEYLVTILGCNDCHTPFKMGPQGPEPDMSRMLSGHPSDLRMPPPPKLPEGPWGWVAAATNTAFAGPWGISYGTNLTPDEKTGLGAWPEELFVKALKTGKQMGAGRPIAPPMPWPGYSHMPEKDLAAIFAYLQTIPPIENRVPAYVPPEQSGVE
jgi:hypothetical protein